MFNLKPINTSSYKIECNNDILKFGMIVKFCHENVIDIAALVYSNVEIQNKKIIRKLVGQELNCTVNTQELK